MGCPIKHPNKESLVWHFLLKCHCERMNAAKIVFCSGKPVGSDDATVRVRLTWLGSDWASSEDFFPWVYYLFFIFFMWYNWLCSEQILGKKYAICMVIFCYVSTKRNIHLLINWLRQFWATATAVKWMWETFPPKQKLQQASVLVNYAVLFFLRTNL